MEKLIANHWNVMCTSARSSAEQLGTDCTAEAKALLRQQAERFCGLPLPNDRAGLQATYTRRMALSARLTAIKRADDAIRTHPDLKQRILRELRPLCEIDFADDGDSFIEFQQANLRLTKVIEEMCFETVGG